MLPPLTEGSHGFPSDAVAPSAGASIATSSVVALVDLLSHWWSRPVPEEVTNWLGVADLADLEAKIRAWAPVNMAELAQTNQDPGLLDEYERLFVGPGPVPCSPYETFWREDVPLDVRRSLMGPCTAELRLLYGELDLEMAPASGELPDHVAVELEALAFALSSWGTWSSACVIWSDHLRRWLPRLCHAVAREAGTPFYRELAQLTTDWSGALQRHIELLGGPGPEAG